MLPMSSRRTALSLAALVVAAQLGFLASTSPVSTANQRLQQLIYDDGAALSYGDQAKSAAKRGSGSGSSRGTCTCTCETKPVAASDHQQKSAAQPQSAHLIRTAARKDTPAADQQALDGVEEAETAAETAAEPAAAAGSVEESTTGDERPAGGHGVDESPSSALSDMVDKQELFDSGQGSWGHGSRYPWKRLPNRMCFRQSCSTDSDCCLRYNLCDASAHVCVDCWYGSACRSERDCCLRYPYCERQWETDAQGRPYVAGGKCVGEN